MMFVLKKNTGVCGGVWTGRERETGAIWSYLTSFMSTNQDKSDSSLYHPQLPYMNSLQTPCPLYREHSP